MWPLQRLSRREQPVGATLPYGRGRRVGDPVRLPLADVLRKHAGKVCVGEPVPLFDLSQPTVSHHLKVLRQAGLVGSECQGLRGLRLRHPRRLISARRVAPTGRTIGLDMTDEMPDPGMDDATKADMAVWTGCIAGALTEAEFRHALEAAGLDGIEITATHQVHNQASSAEPYGSVKHEWLLMQ